MTWQTKGLNQIFFLCTALKSNGKCREDHDIHDLLQKDFQKNFVVGMKLRRW